jgi:hypothetical protein
VPVIVSGWLVRISRSFSVEASLNHGITLMAPMFNERLDVVNEERVQCVAIATDGHASVDF